MHEDDFLEAQYEDRNDGWTGDDEVEISDEEEQEDYLGLDDEDEPPATGTPEWHPSFGYAPNLED